MKFYFDSMQETGALVKRSLRFFMQSYKRIWPLMIPLLLIQQALQMNWFSFLPAKLRIGAWLVLVLLFVWLMLSMIRILHKHYMGEQESKVFSCKLVFSRLWRTIVSLAITMVILLFVFQVVQHVFHWLVTHFHMRHEWIVFSFIFVCVPIVYIWNIFWLAPLLQMLHRTVGIGMYRSLEITSRFWVSVVPGLASFVIYFAFLSMPRVLTHTYHHRLPMVAIDLFAGVVLIPLVLNLNLLVLDDVQKRYANYKIKVQQTLDKLRS